MLSRKEFNKSLDKDKNYNRVEHCLMELAYQIANLNYSINVQGPYEMDERKC